jgi:hypothetical protein
MKLWEELKNAPNCALGATKPVMLVLAEIILNIKITVTVMGTGRTQDTQDVTS